MAKRTRTLIGRALIKATLVVMSASQATAWAQASSTPVSQARNTTLSTDSGAGIAKTQRIWRVEATDSNVREILQRWSTEGGWQLSWEVQNDVELHATASFQGTFEEALEQLLSSLQGSDYPLSACTYDNRVVRIVTSTLTCDRKAS
jgi:hypothetical protein